MWNTSFPCQRKANHRAAPPAPARKRSHEVCRMSSLSPFGRKEVAICVDKADALALKISTSQLSIGEEVRPQSVLGDILACLPEDGAQGAGVEFLV